MELHYYVNQMGNQLDTIISLTSEISIEQARWRPDPDSWSILEVVNHLFDEERSDFRQRLEIILQDPNRKWPPIDPQGWIVDRAYNQRDLVESRDNFIDERRISIEWLESLGNIDWEAQCVAPWGSPIKAGDMFAAWVAHDLLHIRQLVELRWAYLVQSLEQYQVNYAGDW